MNKKSHEEELQEHINALEAKLEEEVKENIKHLGDLRYYEEVQIPELQKQLAEARAEIERKDALIEQMREALEIAYDHICPDGDPLDGRELEVCNKIEAALSAAERGGK